MGMNPFMDFYEYVEKYFEDFIFADYRGKKYKYCLQENQDILRALKENLQVAQNQQKMNVDKHMIERVFQEGDLVY